MNDSKGTKLIENAYNIYCDESRVENPDSQYMIIGGLVIPRSRKDAIKTQLIAIFHKYGFNYELKWTKVRDIYKDFYLHLLDTILSIPDIQFRCIVIDKQKVNVEKYHNSDMELAFFKFYYIMLRPLFSDSKRYYVLLDKKPVRDKNRAHALSHYLKAHLALHKQGCVLKHLQTTNSEDSIFIQVVDFLIGIIGSNANQNSGEFKKELVSYLAERAQIDRTSLIHEKKINILYWQPYEK